MKKNITEVQPGEKFLYPFKGGPEEVTLNSITYSSFSDTAPRGWGEGYTLQIQYQGRPMAILFVTGNLEVEVLDAQEK